MTHGLSKTRLYGIYSGMKQRCYNPADSHYKWYGGKGVTICDEWMVDNGVQNFIEWALSNGYNEDLTIDRIDSGRGYSPDNCRWGTVGQNFDNITVNKNKAPCLKLMPVTIGEKIKSILNRRYITISDLANTKRRNKRSNRISTKMIVLGFVLLSIIIILIFLPWRFKLAVYFSAENYYQIISGIIAGAITLYALLLEFEHERAKAREEKFSESRGFFELNYIIGRQPTNMGKLKFFICYENIFNKQNEQYHYLTMKLHSHNAIMNCTAKFSISGKDNIGYSLGLIIPDQFLILPIMGYANETENIEVTISYTTIMKEQITYKLILKKGLREKCDENKEIMISDTYNTILESNSVLFPFYSEDL